MAESFNVWPSGVPTSYSGESFPLPQDESLLALYNVDLTDPFFLSFVTGGAFVIFFSIARFNRLSRDPNDPVTSENRILEKLRPMDLRSRPLILQAYLLYTAVLLAIYAALTFYGRIILDTLNTVLPTAGYTDTSKFDYASPQWPTFVALTMIGVLPVLPPVEKFEIGLRHWAHRAVGIPLTVYRNSETMRRKLRLRRGVKPGETATYGPDQVPSWLHNLAEPISVSRAYEARDDLKNLIDWIDSGRGDWPSREADRLIERLFDERLAAGRLALFEFKAKVTARSGALPKRPDDVDHSEHRARHIADLRGGWERASADVIGARDDLLALLAVGAEKEPDYGEIESPDLRSLVETAIPIDPIQRGPQLDVVLLLPILAVVFAVAIFVHWHAPAIGSSLTGVGVIVLSTAYELLLIVVIFLLPVGAALNYRFLLRQARPGRWQKLRLLGFEQRGMVQVVIAGILALLVSALGLALLAVAQAGILARTVPHFWRLLLHQDFALLPLTVSLCGLSLIYSLMVLYAVEEKQERKAPRLVLLGILCAAAIFAYQVGHIYLWFGGAGLGGPFLVELYRSPSADLMRYYGATSVVINSLIGFASIAWFLPERRKPAATEEAEERAGAGSSWGAISPALLLLGSLLIAGSAAAEDGDPRYVVVGVRSDAPPFSSVVRIGEKETYTGYLIGLCQQIFAPHPDGHEQYRMVTSEVTVYDRFERLRRDPDEQWRPDQPLAGAKVDLLCDPVTLRYSMEDREPAGARRTDGIFSPLVYVTGVTYLERSRGGTGPTVLGFVGNTTAAKVALQACERDAFRKLAKVNSDTKAACRKGLDDADRRYRDAIDTMRNRRVAGLPSRVPPDPICAGGPASTKGDGTKEDDYRYCIFFNHAAIADWFCSDTERETKFYFGDRDLIVAQTEMRQDRDTCDGVNATAPFYSYEPYALITSPVDPDLARFVQRRIYEIFSNRATALALFAGNFEGKAMSVPLASLFLLNGTEDEMSAPTTGSPDRLPAPTEAPIRQSAR